MQQLRLVTLDLDDTLWSIAPVIAHAETQLYDWLTANCPGSGVDLHTLRELRRTVGRLHPELGDDMSALRRQSIRLAIRHGGGNEALADEAFDVFWTARNEVTCFADVLPALARLKSRFVVGAVSNGNACVHRAGLGDYFDFTLPARVAGCAKPDRAIFLQACRIAGVEPGDALHAGDDIVCDVRGALRAGMHAAWINRDAKALRVLSAPAITVPDLGVLADRLLA